MPGRVLKRKVTPVTASTNKRSTPPDQELEGASPEWLRDRVFDALKTLSPDERESVRDRILSNLRKAGVNITSALVMLGICVRTPDELSPGDVAKLVRYVRMNTPGAMKALGGTLTGLIAPEAQKAEGVKHLRKAA